MPQLRAFGPLALLVDGTEVALGGPKQRAVLAVLVAERGRLVSTDRLVDEIWGEHPPAAARQSVQSYISNLRRLLEGTAAIDGAGTGYVCRPIPGGLDLDRFEELVQEARAVRAGNRNGHARDGGVGQAYGAALAVARGRTFEGFEDLPTVATEAGRLDSLRLIAVEEHLEAEIARGRGPELVPELEALVARNPLRERLWGHLMVGLYQAGRQADALRSYQRARRVLADELGIEPSPELAGLERRLLAQDPDLAPPVRPGMGPAVCPYKGLAPYQAEDAALFHGRRSLVERVVALVGAARFAAVVGASGSGKSSLLRAGLIPAASASGWRVALLTPGADPFVQLTDRLREHARHGERLLVVVDQFEELFTAGADAAARISFARLLAENVTRPESRVSVAVAVRGDFYGRCAELGPLADLLARHHVLVGPLTAAELREAVVAPAGAAGLELEPGLVEDVLADAGNEPGVLPLLSHALLETWLRRDGTTLTRAAYRDSGGLSGAIAATAHTVVGRNEREMARSVVLALVQPGTDGAPDTARRVSLDELPDGSAAIVERLTSARLLTRDDHEVTLAHEALLTSWPDLQLWLEDEREALVERRRLGEAAAEWERLGREPSALLRGSRLATAAELLAGAESPPLPLRERDFVNAGLVQSCRAATRRRAATAGLAVLAAVAVVAAGLAVAGRNQARDEASVATSRRLAAQSALALGLNDRAQALLLGIEAMRSAPTMEARSALGEALVADVDAAAVLTGHEGDVRAAAVSTDGKLAASAGIDGRVRVWDVERTEQRHVFGPFDGEQRDVAFRPDGAAVAAVGIDATLRVWDTATGAVRYQVAAPVAPVGVAPASPAGRAGGGGGGGGGAGAPAAPRPTATEALGFRAVVWSADGRSVAASTTDGQIHVWDADGGRLARSFASGDAEIRDLAFSPDSARLAGSGRDGGIRVWTVQGEPVATLRGHADAAFGVAWSPDGTRLASAGRDRTLRLWTVAAGAADQVIQAQVIQAHSAEIYAVAWSSTGTVATASADRMIRLWDGATGAPSGELKGHSSDARSVAFDGGGNLVSAGNDGTVRVWLGSGATAVRPLSGPVDGMLSLAFAPDGTALAGGARNGDVLVWDVASGTTRSVPAAAGSGEVFGVAMRPDGGQVAFGGSDGTIRLWDPAGGRVAATIASDQGPIWSLAYFGDTGGALVSAGGDGTLRVWDTRTGTSTLTMRGHERDVFALAISPREPVAVSAGRDGTLRRWNVRSDEPGTVILRADGELRAVAFSPDGALVATSGADGLVRLVSTTSWKVVRTLAGHDGEVRTVGFAPDGETLVTGGRDRSVRFWDVRSGDLLARVPAGTGDVRAVAYSPSPGPDSPLAVAANLGPVRLWPAPPDWVQRACAAAGRNLSPAEWDRLVGGGAAYHRTCEFP